MNIGEVAEALDMPAKTIRYYEDIGLVTPARRGNGYRSYSGQDLHRLGFLGRARSLGFSIAECRALLALYSDRGRASADVRRIAEGHLGEIERKIDELAAMRDTLRTLVDCCHGDARPECPILADLAGKGER
ncbi:transcriptional regulator [Haematobacter missouriensis]|uniref:Cu(I)-responsive transcriptional regulator n=1 Tax=Haematobacter missouriensis TaxID=366616 RepID=A0A212APB9_9RHOB|nr:Cu(I)-responsive transcriptional regulator [Haematobacter missouriensis]KFI28288.1 transcriptional regulator [Haematobacter missouriensis]OWJ74759.1 Cu(I)-responsive transcriptional regulator [Haematobacter missouriensis]OWJ83327.1 Cu(I)-responsive transcriptional regulator [Haematobacter missouriensis]